MKRSGGGRKGEKPHMQPSEEKYASQNQHNPKKHCEKGKRKIGEERERKKEKRERKKKKRNGQEPCPSLNQLNSGEPGDVHF